MVPSVSPMTKTDAPPHRRNTAWPSFVPAVMATLVIGLALAATLPAVAPSPPGGRWTGPGAWTNGLLAVQAESDHPAVTVSSGGNATPWGLYAGVGSIGELRADGTPVATADLESASWSVTNASAGPTLELGYAASVRVIGLAGSPGTVQVFVNFTAGPGAAPESSATTVGFTVAVVGWPWASSGDGMALAMPIWPNSTDAAALVPAPGIAGTIDCRSTATHATFESFTWSTAATAVGPAGGTTGVSGSTQLVGGSDLTTVNVVFGGSAAGAKVLRYDPAIGVPGPLAVPAIPLAGYALTVGAAVGVIGLAVGASVRVGRRPPSLMYAE